MTGVKETEIQFKLFRFLGIHYLAMHLRSKSYCITLISESLLDLKATLSELELELDEIPGVLAVLESVVQENPSEFLMVEKLSGKTYFFTGGIAATLFGNIDQYNLERLTYPTFEQAKKIIGNYSYCLTQGDVAVYLSGEDGQDFCAIEKTETSDHWKYQLYSPFLWKITPVWNEELMLRNYSGEICKLLFVLFVLLIGEKQDASNTAQIFLRVYRKRRGKFPQRWNILLN